YLDRRRAYIHEARDQLGMLRAVSKAAFRVWSAATALATLKEAVRTALSPPRGPLSVEIPIDVQEAHLPWPADLAPLAPVVQAPSAASLDLLAERLAPACRPLLWLGGGARGAAEAGGRLVAMGFGVVTSTQGRGILPEDHPMSLGAFTASESVEAFYKACDAMLAVGSRLRGNETLKYALALPRPLYQIDADPRAEGRSYPVALFVCGDARLALEGLADRLAGRMAIDPAFAGDLAAARERAIAGLSRGLGPYTRLIDALQRAAGRDFVWVRDVTISNSTWGNRLLRIFGPRDGVHALGGGIGQGLPMGIGAALAANGRRTMCLVGDGGLMLSLGELATAAQERVNLTLLVMNSRGYEVIKNIQDAQFGGRHYYADLLTPDFGQLAASMGWRYHRLADLAAAEAMLGHALGEPGPTMVEVDMDAIGPFVAKFAGPPVRQRAEAKP
ncbi:MAG TPA: thiamine pyrophosphate-binding protein, partial [Steroidobacteraceae bacterium]|nr:thiamine pyrophosphate-binding protein [Steroidobacteraceae bacterium]